jgi:hypothetical protein
MRKAFSKANLQFGDLSNNYDKVTPRKLIHKNAVRSNERPSSEGLQSMTFPLNGAFVPSMHTAIEGPSQGGRGSALGLPPLPRRSRDFRVTIGVPVPSAAQTAREALLSGDVRCLISLGNPSPNPYCTGS